MNKTLWGLQTVVGHRHRHYSIFALCFAAVFFLAAQAYALTVDNIRFGLHQDKTRMVLDMDDVSKFRAFMLDDPYRLVIDLPQYNWQAGSISKPATSGVNGIRQGNLQPGISRIVVDLNQPMLIESAFNLRANAGKPDRLVIDFSKTSASGFIAGKDKIHGILEIGANTAANAVPSPPPAETDAQQQPRPAPAQKPLVKQASISGMAMPGHKPEPPALPTYDKPMIMIDAGHGGVDPGAIGANGVFEKHIVLSAARELKAALEATGRYKVALTRNADKYLKLYQRVDLARQQNADLFISLHADTIGKSHVRGASVYTLSENASDEQTEKLAARENKADLIAGVDLSHEDKQVADILVDLTMRDTMNQSKFFANTLVGYMDGSGIRTLERPHRYAGFAVLKAPDIPSVLVELGFLSNQTEARMLAKPEYRQQIIRALVKGIDGYFEKVRLNQKT